MLEAAVEDVERDLAGSPTKQDLHDAVAWIIEAARPLFRTLINRPVCRTSCRPRHAATCGAAAPWPVASPSTCAPVSVTVAAPGGDS